ncbi:MAG: hypothetical protein J6Y83_04860 [Bacteroidales bacterium]|nr:hypothetical protein [Bacteroidales bacterium]
MDYTYTVDEFKAKMLVYFRDCEEKRLVFPDEAGMLNFLDIEDEEYEALKTEPGYDKLIRWARRRRTSWLERRLVEGGKNSAGCMNALKQEKNGGYSEKAEGPKERKLIVKIEGVTEIGGKK